MACPAPRLTGRELLTGTSFRAVLGGGAGPQWTSWGQGASVSAFSSATPSLSLSGETATGSIGMDYEWGRLLTGFAMTHSLGEGTAEGAGRSYVMGSTVTTMLPYLRYALSERLSAWGLAGTGTGRLTLDLAGGAPERYSADLSMSLAAMGVRGDLVTPAEAGGFALALKADAFWVRTESDAVSVPGAGNLAAARGEASRLRAVLDGSRSFALAGGATLTPSVAFGVRHDGGDAETGTGMEFGAGLGYAAPSRGLDMALRVHGLASHAEDGYGEWGVSGSLTLVPGAAGRGLSMSLTPSWGVDPGGSERLWMLPDVSGLAANDGADPSGRLDAEVGYGLALFGGGFTGTPHVGMGLSDTARELPHGLAARPGGRRGLRAQPRRGPARRRGRRTRAPRRARPHRALVRAGAGTVSVIPRPLLGAALAVGALWAFHAAPAPAQTAVWSATLTVDRGGGLSGCDNNVAGLDSCSSATVLTDDDFTYGGTTYTVSGIHWSRSTNTFELRVSGLPRQPDQDRPRCAEAERGRPVARCQPLDGGVFRHRLAVRPVAHPVRGLDCRAAGLR